MKQFNFEAKFSPFPSKIAYHVHIDSFATLLSASLKTESIMGLKKERNVNARGFFKGLR